LFIGEGNGLEELLFAWQDCFEQEIDELTLEEYLKVEQGQMVEIGRNQKGQNVYWISVGQSKKICLQAWADLWDMLGDSILNWELVELNEGRE